MAPTPTETSVRSGRHTLYLKHRHVVIEATAYRYAPSQGGSKFSAQASAGGLAGLVSAGHVRGLVERLEGTSLTGTM